MSRIRANKEKANRKLSSESTSPTHCKHFSVTQPVYVLLYIRHLSATFHSSVLKYIRNTRTHFHYPVTQNSQTNSYCILEDSYLLTSLIGIIRWNRGISVLRYHFCSGHSSFSWITRAQIPVQPDSHLAEAHSLKNEISISSRAAAPQLTLTSDLPQKVAS